MQYDPTISPFLPLGQTTPQDTQMQSLPSLGQIVPQSTPFTL